MLPLKVQHWLKYCLFCNLRTVLNNFEPNAVMSSLMSILASFSWLCFLSSFLLDMTRFPSSLDMNRMMMDCGSPAGAPRGFGSLWLMLMSSRHNGGGGGAALWCCWLPPTRHLSSSRTPCSHQRIAGYCGDHIVPVHRSADAAWRSHPGALRWWQLVQPQQP